MANYERIMALILIERFPAEPLARQLQAYLAAPPADNSMSFLYHEEFLWFNPDQPAEPPSLLTHYAAGTGTLFMRSGWPGGAADTDPGATYLTFQAGDHFTYHQHYDQNSFTLFKRGDLAVDSGVYSGDGLSDHDINYYVRTIAHNTLVVYNPAEDFSSARPDATSNDGGQRTLYPASRSPTSIEYFDQHAVHYDTGDMLRFEDAAGYTYALGDATKAYNNPTYNQAMDTGLSRQRGQGEPLPARVRLPATAADQRHAMADADAVAARRRLPRPLRPRRRHPARLQRGEHQAAVPHAERAGRQRRGDGHLARRDALHRRRPGDGDLRRRQAVHQGAAARGAQHPQGRRSRGEGLLGLRRATTTGTGIPASRSRGRSTTSRTCPTASGGWSWSRPTPRWSTTSSRCSIPPSAARSSLPATTLITGTGLAGAHIADPALNRVALFSAAADGSAPTGTLELQLHADHRHPAHHLRPGARQPLPAPGHAQAGGAARPSR